MATVLAANLGTYGGGQTVAVDGATVHVGYTEVAAGSVGAGPTMYMRSLDNGANWEAPKPIGEAMATDYRQARVQITAADGYVFACWQREPVSGSPLPADRLGYNRSQDGGVTWGTAQVLPEDTGINRNHQHVWMASGGGVHIIWRHGNTTTGDDTGYMHSQDYGATWGPSTLAIESSETNHPFGVVADGTAAHIVTAPAGNFQYAYRLLQ